MCVFFCSKMKKQASCRIMKMGDRMIEIGKYHIDLWTLLDHLWLPVIEVGIGIYLGPKLKKIIMKTADKSLDRGATTFLASCVNILVIALAGILALEELGVNLKSIVSLVSALGLGIALALKSNMANVAGGLQILMTKPFTVGEFISTPDHKGTVTSIELMFTTIRTNNNKLVVIPNSNLVTESIVNHSKNKIERIKLVFPVNIPFEMDSIKKEVDAIVSSNPKVVQAAGWELTVKNIQQGYANCLLLVSCNTVDYETLMYELNKELVEKLSVYQDTKKNSSSN